MAKAKAKAKSKAKAAAKPKPKAKAKPAARAKPTAKAKPAARAKSAAKAKPTTKTTSATKAKASPTAKATSSKAASPKTPSPKTPSPKAKASSSSGLRGVALVEAVIAKIDANGGVLGGCGVPDHPASGLAADALATLTLPDGRPLPPSLARFLAYDATHLGVLDSFDPPRLAWRTFNAMMQEQFDEQTADIYGDFSTVLPGYCLVLPEGADSRRFLYAGEPDEHGEYPVLVVDTDDIPFVCVAYPGLDVYLADGVTDEIIKGTYTDGFDHPVYGPAMVDQARRNFRGFKSLDFGGDTEHVDGEEAAQAMLADVFGAGDAVPMPIDN